MYCLIFNNWLVIDQLLGSEKVVKLNGIGIVTQPAPSCFGTACSYTKLNKKAQKNGLSTFSELFVYIVVPLYVNVTAIPAAAQF